MVRRSGSIKVKFLKAITVKEFRKILENIPQLNLEKEIIPLEKGFNRVLSDDVTSEINVPHFRKSRMDGYAVIAEDTFGAEEDNIISLELIEIIQAGDIPQKKLTKGQCSYVATGAAIPDGADAVVMVEFTDRIKEKVEISRGVSPGKHIVNIGHDVKKGDIVCKNGRLIDLATLGILTACGVKEISVYKKPVVSLLSTGDELLGREVSSLPVGKIYDINSVVLKKAIENTGSEIIYLGIVGDVLEELKQKMNEALKQSDVVILSGGTSKGEGDLGPKVLESYENIEIMVHGVKQKPGKPILFVKLKDKIVFILPGFPTSALSCFYVFIDDFLRRMSGYPLRKRFSQTFEVGERIYSELGRNEFKAVKLIEDKLYPIKTGSEAISTLFYADGYIEIDELEEIVEKGDKKEFYTF